MKTKNSYNTKYNTLWHNVGWGWKLVGRKDQMNRNLKKEGVTWYLCYYIYIYGSFSETVYQYCDIGTKKSKCFKTPNM